MGKQLQQLSQSFRVSVRVSGSVTSISIRKNLIALWVVMNDIEPDSIRDSLVDFVYSYLDSWNGETAKGFSDFISEKLIQSLLEDKDYIVYKRILADI